MQRLFTKREKLISYLTAAVIVFGILFNFFIAPFLSKNDALNKEINLTRQKLKKYLWLLSQSEEINNKAKDFPSSIKAVNQQGEASVAILAELEELAKDANIRIIELRPAAAGKTLIDLRAEGNTEGYLKFIYSLENSLSLFKIKKFQLSAKSNPQILESNFSITQLPLSE